jgi:glucose-1-phosphate thymidylyltransferase
MERGIQIKGEYYIADAINIMLEEGYKGRTEKVDVWLDTGVPQTVLETNRYLLEHGKDNSSLAQRDSVVVIPPVFIHESAQIKNSIIGPYVSIGAECVIETSIIRNSILDNKSAVIDTILESSFVGRHVQVEGRPSSINIGDDSVISF